jgi:hypothetical protein
MQHAKDGVLITLSLLEVKEGISFKLIPNTLTSI